MHIILPATLATAAAATLINLWLGWRVGEVRKAEKVSIGDGGSLALIARMRAHANFAEYAPIILILLGLIELARGTSAITWGYGAAFVVARIAHGLGMDSWKPGRSIGTAITFVLMLVLAGHAAVLVLHGGALTGDAVPVEVMPSV